MSRAGNQTFIFDNKPRIISSYSVVGPKEGAGRFDHYYDEVLEDDSYGEKSYEKAESKMLKTALERVVEKKGLTFADVDMICSGDLLNQIASSSFAARGHDAMTLGVYSACATFGEALATGAALIDAGFINTVICATGSHFSSAERQYRYPLELGNQRPPIAQWTVTAAGASLLTSTEFAAGRSASGIAVTAATIGKIVDKGVIDPNNMGAAMAPAAAETIFAHFKDTGRPYDYYDAIFTGDLGKYGLKLCNILLEEKGVKLNSLQDCGALIYNEGQDTEQGGSGAGCSSAVFNSYIIKEMKRGRYNKVLLVPTGALLSRTFSEQGESIPAIAHAVAIERIEVGDRG